MRLQRFCPTWTAPSVTAIDPAFFQEHSIRAVILDLDNTLVPWRGEEIPPEVSGWVRAMRAAGIRLCILSNTHRPERLRRLASAFDIPFVPGSSKPRRRGYLEAMALLGASVAETAMVGDQMLTDVWGGNRCGMMTVMVERLSDREFVMTRWLSRRVEALLLKRMHRRGLLRAVAGRQMAVGSGKGG